ncbi:MAG: MBL fold metallo-hydrolase [Sphingomonas bacterium]|nr:MBL fold metallo-hydrolase [Sphingomonas bacterium]
MRARILGSGTSSGVPRIGNDWGACNPSDARNRRSRSSLLIKHNDTRILIDTSPDMREQLIAADVATVDAVIWTHDHADHCHGIDDLRQVYHARRSPVPGYARRATLDVLTDRFAYAFSGRAGYPPTIEAHELGETLTIGDVVITTVDQPHGSISSVGMTFAADGVKIGYATDFNVMTDAMAALYQDLDVWIVDALRREPHPSHPTLANVIDWVDQLKPRQAALVHMDNSMDYAALCAALAAPIEPGYDGMVLPR